MVYARLLIRFHRSGRWKVQSVGYIWNSQRREDRNLGTPAQKHQASNLKEIQPGPVHSDDGP